MSRRGPRSASDRLRRLLVMLPWLMEHGDVSVADMARHFAVTEKELVRDLELASMCGLPPFVDEMIDVFIDEGMVYVGVRRLFTRPLRLTAPEGFGLLAAGRAAMALPGAEASGSLGRALAKLAAALGTNPAETGDVVVDLARPPLADALVAAVERGERMRITYWTPARGEAAERVVTPRLVFEDGGRWYLRADDDRSGEQRSFRIDRVLDVVATGEFVDPVVGESAHDRAWFADDPEIGRVTLRVPDSAMWMIERYPIDSTTARGDGTNTVVMPATTQSWVAHLLLRLGPTATVLAPEEWVDLGQRTAAAVLANYA